MAPRLKSPKPPQRTGTSLPPSSRSGKTTQEPLHFAKEEKPVQSNSSTTSFSSQTSPPSPPSTPSMMKKSAADFFPVASTITTLTAITSYIGFFAILWFTWLQVVLYDVRFGCDSLFERLCKLVHFGTMVTFAIIGTRFDPSRPHETYITMRQLSMVLIVSRVVLICQYGSVMWWVRKHERITTPLSVHIVSFAIGAMLCLGFFFAFTEQSSGQGYVVWYVIIAVEALVVFVSSSQWSAVSFGHTNLDERFGLLTLIILGEGIIVLTKSMNYITKGENFTPGIIAQIISAVLII
ncbi:MAG: hypothetical protein Q9183_007516, partial [Haloplaca sp. 2 TL-2023]